MKNLIKYAALLLSALTLYNCSKATDDDVAIPTVREINVGIPLSVNKGEAPTKGLDVGYYPEGNYPLDFAYLWVITGWDNDGNLQFTPVKFSAGGSPIKINVKVYENAAGNKAWIGDADSTKGTIITDKVIMIASGDTQHVNLDQEGYSFSGRTPIYKCLTLKGIKNAQGTVDGDIVFRQKSGYYRYDFEKNDFAEYNDNDIKTGVYLSAGVAMSRMTSAINVNFVITDLSAYTNIGANITIYNWTVNASSGIEILDYTFKRYTTNVGLIMDMTDPDIEPEASGTLLVAATDGSIKGATTITHADNVGGKTII